MFRQGLVALLEEAQEIEVVGQASGGDEALQLIRQLGPAIAILDVSMPGATGIEVARSLAQDGAPTKVVLLTMHADATHARKAIDAGASGYVVKGAVFDELLKAVSIARNRGQLGTDFATCNFDMMHQYRALTNVVERPPREGLSVICQHEIVLPILHQALLAEGAAAGLDVEAR